MSLAEQRRIIRPLINQSHPADAMAAYYAFYHPDNKTQLFPYAPNSGQVKGYVAVSRTGLDLFRPLITMRLASQDLDTNLEVIYSALPPGTAVMLSAPAAYLPLLEALFEIQTQELLRLLVLDDGRFKPVINVLVMQTVGANQWPRFVIKRQEQGREEVLASAGLNWQSPGFAEISVGTIRQHRRQGMGRSVVAATVQHLLHRGRKPLYRVAEGNQASIRLAESIGFVDLGIREALLQAVLKPRP